LIQYSLSHVDLLGPFYPEEILPVILAILFLDISSTALKCFLLELKCFIFFSFSENKLLVGKLQFRKSNEDSLSINLSTNLYFFYSTYLFEKIVFYSMYLFG
jgi:hypothetical protein